MTLRLDGPFRACEIVRRVKGMLAAEPIVAAMVDALAAAGEMAQRFAVPVGP